jgi:hypothetical protein
MWWARVISQADVVDLDFVRAQTRVRNTRAAVRRYVHGGYRRGLSLNPLFIERVVGGQLSDAHRVPALYAYLVNHAASIETANAWSASAYARAHPESLSSPGGPLGHAWRSARRSGSLRLGSGRSARTVPWAHIAEAAAHAIRTEPSVFDDTESIASETIAVIRVSPAEADSLEPLRAAEELNLRERAFVIVALPDGVDNGARVDAALTSLANPRLVVRRDRDNWPTAVRRASASGGTLLVRGPGAEIAVGDLRALIHAGAQAPTSPVWLAPDGTVASAGWFAHEGRLHPLLGGHPVEDARSLGPAIATLAPTGETFALPLHAGGSPIVATELSVRAAGQVELVPTDAPDSDVNDLVAPLGFRVARWTQSGPVYAAVRERRSDRLRWAIRTAAPAGPAGEVWGDTHFARGIADALRRLGQDVVIDTYAARHRPSRYLDDVVLALRGPEPIEPQVGARSLIWIISHPDQITARELSGFDAIFAGSAGWARDASRRFDRPVVPLLQCTDAHRFRPTASPRGEDFVFVGTARGIERPSVVEPLRAGIPISVYGPDWRGYIPGWAIKGTRIPNADLPAVYETARAVLNDHWPAMQANGFVSNRLYDVVAAGGRAISDYVDGIDGIFHGAVLTYRSIPELLDLLRSDLDARFPAKPDLERIAAEVAAQHSFDARARTLLDAALSGHSFRQSTIV